MQKILFSVVILLALGFIVSCNKSYSKITNDILNSNHLIESTDERILSLYRDSKNNKNRYNGSSKDMVMVEDAQSSVSEDASANIEETSKTTIQEDGVLEADTIKNDGRYIYMSVRKNNDEELDYYSYCNNLLVIDTINNTKKTYDITEENSIIWGLYLLDNKLVVIASYYKDYEDNDSDNKTYNGDLYYYERNTNTLVVNIYDSTDPFELKLLKTNEYNKSYYEDSRLIGNKLYLFGSTFFIKKDKIDYPTNSINGENIEVSSKDILIVGGEKIYNYGSSYRFIASIDLSNGDDYYKGYYGMWGQYYVSKDNIFIISNSYSNNDLLFSEYDYCKLYSSIHRISIEDGTINYIKSLTIPGYIYSRFALNENNDVLRIALTYNNKEQKNSNILCTIDCKNSNFLLLDSYDNFGIGESIYSVTYDNNLAYIVTYMYIDPLFEFDLSHPKDIKLLKQLKTPGVSDYLDKINDEYVLGIGRETEVHEKGNNTYATTIGIKLSLFKVIGEKMSEEYTYKLSSLEGVTYSYSSVLYDIHTLIKLKDSLIYLFPIQINGFNSTFSGSGIIGFQVDLDNKTINNIGFINQNYSDRIVVIRGAIYKICFETSDVNVYKINKGLLFDNKF